ncbi:hypothetical protein E2C01_052524 [Portunus trituberculatus]|uniref:Uncharacterized protein n=1 Tax=Portunus trituberculatus TaxID=210409 RepID=A0A5B7GN94_PORTR|nr:hypothetical protein [Portunus trituberculatus]
MEGREESGVINTAGPTNPRRRCSDPAQQACVTDDVSNLRQEKTSISAGGVALQPWGGGIAMAMVGWGRVAIVRRGQEFPVT